MSTQARCKLCGEPMPSRYRADWDVHLTGLLDRLATAEARVRELEGEARSLRDGNRKEAP